MNYRLLLFVLLLGLGVPFIYAQEEMPFRDENLPAHERVMDLLSRLTIEEKISLLYATSQGIPRLQIPKYYHGNEALHGVVRPGRFTVFPFMIGSSSGDIHLIKEFVL